MAPHGPTNPSGLDYKSMKQFINEEACRATMEINGGHLRQYGPGHSDGWGGPPAFNQSGPYGQPQLLSGPILCFTRKFDLKK